MIEGTIKFYVKISKVITMFNWFINKLKPNKGFNKIICLDFDGVVHSYTSGWKGDAVISDPPVPGAIDFIRKHLPLPDALGISGNYNGPIVQIYSSRSKTRAGINAMKKWLIENGLEKEYIDDNILKFPTKKPAAWLTIDDRAICFNGKFPSTKEIEEFKPWNK